MVFCLSHINNNYYDLITTYTFNHFYDVIKLKEICLHLQVSPTDNVNLNKQLVFFSFLELISNQKPTIIRSKKIKFVLTFKNGLPIGCKVNLRRKEMYFFLDYFLFQVLGYIVYTKKFKAILNDKSYRLIIYNLYPFTEINKKYTAFSILNNLTIDFFFFHHHLVNKLLF